MRIIAVITIFLFFSNYSNAQEFIYLNSAKKIVKKKKRAFYYQKVNTIKTNSIVELRTIEGDLLLEKFESLKNNHDIKNGLFESWYKNGKLKEHGYYLNNLKTGVWAFYSQNGFITKKGEYNEHRKNGIWKYYFANGKLEKEVEYKNNVLSGIWNYYYQNGKLETEGHYTNDQRSGVWQQYNIDGQKESKFTAIDTINYYHQVWNDSQESFLNNGNGTKVISFPPNLTRHLVYSDSIFVESFYLLNNRDTVSSEDIKFTNPEFPNGNKEMYKYLGKNIYYPDFARSVDIQGRVFIEFIVNRDGTISKVKVIKGIGGGCDEEALRIVKNMPNWTSGKLKNKPIKMKMVLPIYFKLNN